MVEGGSKNSFKFPKAERLHHRSLVEGLFRLGKTFYEFPFRVSWRILSAEELRDNFRCNVPEAISPVQMMVAIPKKKRRRAVDRVLMRRRIREAYRLNRHSFCEYAKEKTNAATISLAFVYIHNENLPYNCIEEKMMASLEKLKIKIDKCSNPQS